MKYSTCEKTEDIPHENIVLKLSIQLSIQLRLLYFLFQRTDVANVTKKEKYVQYYQSEICYS